MKDSTKAGLTAGIIGGAVIITPIIIACLLDANFTSICHTPILGVSGVAVALCDSFYSQVISYTQSIPFSKTYTPARAQELVSDFNVFHRKILHEWIIIKLASGATVTFSAILALSLKNNDPPNIILLIIGYFALGISLRSVLFFLIMYSKARNAYNNLRLDEISEQFEKDNPITPLSEEVITGLNKQSSNKYNAPPVTLKPK